MNRTDQGPSNPSGYRKFQAAVMIAAAVTLPWLALVAGGYRAFESWGFTAMPFVMGRMAIVHLLAGLPFAIWLAWHGPRRYGGGASSAAAVAAMAGVVIGLAFIGAAPAFANWCDGLSGGERYTARIFTALFLQLPWCWAAVILIDHDPTPSSRPPFDWWTALLIVTMVPWVYREHVMTRQASLLSDALVNDRYAEASLVTRKLAAMGVEQIAGQDAELLDRELDQLLQATRRAVQQPLPVDADAEQRLRRAQDLHRLGRYDEVTSALGSLVQTDPRAVFRAALALEVTGQWRDAADAYQRLLDRLRELQSDDPNARSLARNGLQRLANNRRRMGQFDAAEAVLRQALIDWPLDRATTELQLGFHYAQVGRIRLADQAFDRAVELSPELQSVVEAERQKQRMHMEGCFLGKYEMRDAVTERTPDL